MPACLCPTYSPSPEIPATLAMLALASTPAVAGTMSASLTPPAVLGEDIANYAAVTGNDKWFAENSGAGAVKGQTFTTGSYSVRCKSITYQVTSSQKAEPTKTYVVRLGTVSGTTFGQIHTETFTQNFTWNGGEYMTWTFDTPVLLSPNTTYGIDIGMTASTSAWQTGIPYINLTGNAYTGGVRYSSGTSGIGTGTLSLVSITEQNNGFASGIDKVTVALPANLAGDGKLFARLSVVVTTP